MNRLIVEIAVDDQAVLQKPWKSAARALDARQRRGPRVLLHEQPDV